MSKCQVVAIFTPKPEFAEDLKALLAEVAVEVRTENGCLFYDLFKDVDGKLWFIEAWQTRELWQEHNGAPTVTRINEYVVGKLEKPVEVFEMYEVPQA